VSDEPDDKWYPSAHQGQSACTEYRKAGHPSCDAMRNAIRYAVGPIVDQLRTSLARVTAELAEAREVLRDSQLECSEFIDVLADVVEFERELYDYVRENGGGSVSWTVDGGIARLR
jgi:hypothetical protein